MPAVEEFIEHRTLRVREASRDALLPVVPEVSPAGASSTAAMPQPAPARATPAPTPAAPRPGADLHTMQGELLQLIAEKTGYDPSELELDFELEADLGIDTVKQAEIFSELRERHGLERDDDFSFAEYNTIEKLARYLADQASASSAPAASPATPAPAPAEQALPTPAPAPAATAIGLDQVLSELTALIAEKTGYDADELESDFELEADLGIDTVKQAEIFSELRERYGLERDDEFSFAEYNTIDKLAGYLADAVAAMSAGGGAGTPAPAVADPPVEDDASVVAAAEPATPGRDHERERDSPHASPRGSGSRHRAGRGSRAR